MSDAQTLFDARAFEGSYYLAGYAIECALKACIAKRTREFDFPEKRAVERSYTHDLAQLMDAAGVKDQLAEKIAGDEGLRESWATVKAWSEASRYAVHLNEESAQNMLAAVGDDVRGILPWLKKRW